MGVMSDGPKPGDRLRKVRMAKGLSQAALADKCAAMFGKCSHGTVSHYETGHVPMSLKWANRFGAALGTEPMELMFGVGNDGQVEAEEYLVSLYRRISPKRRKMLIENAEAYLDAKSASEKAG